MTDPKRWNETDDADDADARLLVATLSKAEPTAAMRESVWAKVAATLPTGPGSDGPNDGGGGSANGGGSAGGATGAGANATGGAALGTGAKLMIAAALAAGALSLWVLTRTDAPATHAAPSTPVATSTPTLTPTPTPTPTPTEPPTPTPTPTSTPTEPLIPSPSVAVAPAASAPSPPQRPTATPSSPVAPAPSTATATPAALAADRLREEAEGVKRARQLLRDKNPTAALTELDRLGRLFPSGPLEEEREVLTIEALVGSSGTADLGRRRAERFLAERPQSVHAARVRGLAGR
jgi:hypothetical protein